MSADLLPAIRASLVGDADIIDELTAYAGSYPVFTRRPVPNNAPYPLIVVNPQIQVGQVDGISDQKPILTHDIAVYGRNGMAGTVDNYRAVERIAFLIHQLFHRRPASVSVSGWGVVDVTALGPFPAPVDDEQTVGRRVEVTARLARLD